MNKKTKRKRRYPKKWPSSRVKFENSKRDHHAKKPREKVNSKQINKHREVKKWKLKADTK